MMRNERGNQVNSSSAYILDERRKVVRRVINQKQQALNSAYDARSAAQQELSTAQAELASVRVELNSFQQETKIKTQQKEQLQAEYRSINSQKKSIEKKQSQLDALLQTNINKRALMAQQLQGDINSVEGLKRSIHLLDMLLKKEKPQPTYRLDGEYCINNIYHCQNHPPRQLLTNKEELDFWDTQRIINTNKRQQLQRQLDEANRADRGSQADLDTLDAAIEDSKNQLQEINVECNYIDNQMKDNLAKQQALNQDIEKDRIAENEIENRLRQLDSSVDYLASALGRFEQDVETAETNLAMAQSEFEQLSSQLDSAQNDFAGAAPPSEPVFKDPFAAAADEIHKKFGIPKEIDFGPPGPRFPNSYPNNGAASGPQNQPQRPSLPSQDPFAHFDNGNEAGQNPNASYPSNQPDPFANFNYPNHDAHDPSAHFPVRNSDPFANIGNNPAHGANDPFANFDNASTPERHSPTFFSKVVETVKQTYNDTQQRQADLKEQQDEQRNRHDYIPNPATQRMLDRANAEALGIHVAVEPEKPASFLPQIQQVGEVWDRNKATVRDASQYLVKAGEKMAPKFAPGIILKQGIKELVARRVVAYEVKQNISVFKAIHNNAKTDLNQAFDADLHEKKEQITKFMEGDARDKQAIIKNEVEKKFLGKK